MGEKNNIEVLDMSDIEYCIWNRTQGRMDSSTDLQIGKNYLI